MLPWSMPFAPDATTDLFKARFHDPLIQSNGLFEITRTTQLANASLQSLCP